MPNKKISQLTINHSPRGDSLLPIALTGTTQAITLSGLSNYISVGLATPIKNVIVVGDNILINTNYQYTVYGDLLLQGNLVNAGLITIINGNLVNSGGTYTSSGGTIELVTTSDATLLTLKDNASSGDTIDLATSNRKTIVKLINFISGDTNFVCSDVSNNQPGDILFLSSPLLSSGDTFNYNFTDSFYITACGNSHEPQLISFNGQSRDMIMFIFDGELWLSTFDNC